MSFSNVVFPSEKAALELQSRDGRKYLKYAASFYEKRFQYDIKTENHSNGTDLLATVTFRFGGQPSKWPITFRFVRATGKLIGKNLCELRFG